MMKKSVVQIMMILAMCVVMITCTTTRQNNPVAVEIDGQVTAIISCKSRSSNYCGKLSVVAKLSNDTVPYSNEVILNNALLPNLVLFRSFAAARIDSNQLVVTALGKETQYIFVLGIQSAQLSLIKSLQPIKANNVVAVDIIPITGLTNEFYVVADLKDKRKIARVSDSTFQPRQMGSRSNNMDSTSISGNANGAYITETGDCNNEKNYYVSFAQDGSISQCTYQRLSVCSDSGRQSLAFINDHDAVWAIVRQDNVLTYKLSASVTGTKSILDNRSVPTPSTRDWNTASTSLSCTEGSLMTSSNVIDLPNKISDVDLTFDSSSNELVVSFSQQTSPTTCSIEGYFYNVNPTTLDVTRAPDSSNLPSVPCAELGFDRVLFDNDFVLLRYETTKINLQSVFPGQTL